MPPLILTSCQWRMWASFVLQIFSDLRCSIQIPEFIFSVQLWSVFCLGEEAWPGFSCLAASHLPALKSKTQQLWLQLQPHCWTGRRHWTVSSLVVLHWRSRIQSHSLGSHIGKYLWKHFVKGRDVCLHAGDHVLKGVHVLLFHSLLQFLMNDAIPSARCGRCVFVPCNRVFTSPSFRNMYHESCNMECKIHEELVTVRYVGEISALFLHRRCWFHLAVQRPWTAPSHVTAIGTGRETERLFGRSPTLHPVPKKCAPSASIPTRSSHFPSASFKQESMILSSSSL